MQSSSTLSFPSPSKSWPGGWCSLTCPRQTSSLRRVGGTGAWLQGHREHGRGGGREANSEAFLGTFIGHPNSSDARYPILTVSEDANAGMACFYLKHRCFSWSYNSIILKRFTWFRADKDEDLVSFILKTNLGGENWKDGAWAMVLSTLVGQGARTSPARGYALSNWKLQQCCRVDLIYAGKSVLTHFTELPLVYWTQFLRAYFVPGTV